MKLSEHQPKSFWKWRHTLRSYQGSQIDSSRPPYKTSQFSVSCVFLSKSLRNAPQVQSSPLLKCYCRWGFCTSPHQPKYFWKCPTNLNCRWLRGSTNLREWLSAGEFVWGILDSACDTQFKGLSKTPTHVSQIPGPSAQPVLPTP